MYIAQVENNAARSLQPTGRQRDERTIELAAAAAANVAVAALKTLWENPGRGNSMWNFDIFWGIRKQANRSRQLVMRTMRCTKAAVIATDVVIVIAIATATATASVTVRTTDQSQPSSAQRQRCQNNWHSADGSQATVTRKGSNTAPAEPRCRTEYTEEEKKRTESSRYQGEWTMTGNTSNNNKQANNYVHQTDSGTVKPNIGPTNQPFVRLTCEHTLCERRAKRRQVALL